MKANQRYPKITLGNTQSTTKFQEFLLLLLYESKASYQRQIIFHYKTSAILKKFVYLHLCIISFPMFVVRELNNG